MFKFLRKYNKWILAVGGGLLMIVFLLGQTLQDLTAGAGARTATRATVGPDGREKISAEEWTRYLIQADFIRAAEASGQPFLPIGKLEGTEHWLLLVREAQQAGLITAPGSIQISEDELLGLSQQGISPDQYRQFVANAQGVQRLLMLYLEAGDASDHRLRDFASRIFHQVEAEVAVIKASADSAAVQPTEAQLQEHLETYRDFMPGEGPMGLGYRLPDRAKLEWLHVGADDVRQAIAASDALDGVALWYHWQRSTDSNLPPYDPDATEIPFEVREDLLGKLTTERLDRIVSFIGAQLSGSRRGLEQREGYYVLPDDWGDRRLELTQLAKEIQQQREVPLPGYQSTGNWVAVDELRELEGIGTATTDRFGAPRGLPALVAGAKELGASDEVMVQAGVEGPVLRGENGDIFVFRILEIDASRPPQTVDEVREQIVNDFNRVAAYQSLLERASELEQFAAEEGLLALALEHDAQVEQRQLSLASVELARLFVQVGQMPQVMPTALPVIGQHRETVEVIIDHARSLPTGEPLSEVPVEQRMLVVPVEEHLALVVARIVGQKPLAREQFAQVASEGIAQRMLFAEELKGIEHLQAAFSLETLSAKHNLTVIRSSEEEELELASAQ